MPKPTRTELFKFAFAGIAFILIANPLLNYIMFLSLKASGLPMVIHGSSYGFLCGKVSDDFFETHPGALFWFMNGHNILILTFVVIGFIWYSLIKKHNRVQRSIGWWLSILFMTLPLYFSAQIITIILIRVIRGVAIAPLFTTSGIVITIVMLAYSIVAGLWLYLKVFRKEERRYLWLISLPAIIVTFLSWFFVLSFLVWK